MVNIRKMYKCTKTRDNHIHFYPIELILCPSVIGLVLVVGPQKVYQFFLYSVFFTRRLSLFIISIIHVSI